MLTTVPELISEMRSGLRLLDATTALTECKNKNGTVIDVREPAEVEAKPSQGAVNIPRGVLEMMVLAKLTDENHPIYLHCASGVRATFAAEQLLRLGYTDVTVITCGIDTICASQS